MNKDEILVYIYNNQSIIAYCKTICSNDWQELKSQLIIQLIKMPDYKLLQAQQKNYLEYLCFVIAKRIVAGRVKDSGDFYLSKNHLSLEEGYGLDVIEEDFINNDKIDKIEIEINKLHWYAKTLFNYVYKDGYKLREISEMTGINLKSISYTINKTKKEIKNKFGQNGTNNIND
jgi:DNA-directed RNA polymerase specialized sigma24 family protein